MLETRDHCGQMKMLLKLCESALNMQNHWFKGFSGQLVFICILLNCFKINISALTSGAQFIFWNQMTLAYALERVRDPLPLSTLVQDKVPNGGKVDDSGFVHISHMVLVYQYLFNQCEITFCAPAVASFTSSDMLYKCLFCLLLLGQIRPVIFPGGCFNSFYPRPSINRRDNFISTWVAYSPNINIFTPISVIPSSYTTLPWPWPPVLFPPHHLPSFLLHYNQFKDQTSTDLNVIQVLLD